MVNNPGDSVRVVLFNKGNPDEVLVLDESDDIGNFKLPGGKFDHTDELPADAADREVSEEIISASGKIHLAHASELINDDGVSKRHIFFGSVNPDDIEVSDEINSYMWVTDPPEGKNKHHMQTAILAAKHALQQSK